MDPFVLLEVIWGRTLISLLTYYLKTGIMENVTLSTLLRISSNDSIAFSEGHLRSNIDNIVNMISQSEGQQWFRVGSCVIVKLL